MRKDNAKTLNNRPAEQVPQISYLSGNKELEARGQ